MRRTVIPILAPNAKPRQMAAGYRETKSRGLAVLNSPLLNKGTAFTMEERASLGLNGLLPPDISTLADQVSRAYNQYERLPDAVTKNIYLTSLHDRNEVLFYRLFCEHIYEMIPIVNDVTVGSAMEQYHHECRRPRGVYLSINQPDGIEAAFASLGAGPDDIDLILATDAENILGVGDWGIGGIEIAIGKLAIYTAAGGIDPARAIPVMLDVGTNRPGLLEDPTYIGNRHPRVRGERYDAFIEAYVETVSRLFPHVLLQWEDLAAETSRRIMVKYRRRICMFNDDMQGTGAIVLAAAISAVRASGVSLRNQRVVIFGVGSAGIGIADQFCEAMVHEGISAAEATSRFWCLDQQGLLTANMAEALGEHQMAYARSANECAGWKRDGERIGLAEVVRQVRPTMLIGAAPVGGCFTEAIVREMAAHTERPIIFALCHQRTHAAASPADLIAWTEGRALVATGASFSPVTYKGVTFAIAQLNNAMLYPGLVLGAIVSRASRISNGMFAAAASAVSSLVTVRQPGASLLPHVNDLRSVAATVAVATAEAAVAEGLARLQFEDIVQEVQDAMWRPEYLRLQAS